MSQSSVSHIPIDNDTVRARGVATTVFALTMIRGPRDLLHLLQRIEGDRNMRRDEFLRRELAIHGGWLPLNILIRFNQLAKLSRNTEIIAKALKKSSGFLEVSEDNKKVRRRPDAPVPELTAALKREITNRSLYAKGYPKDTTFDDLIMHYKKYDIENIMMRKFQRGALSRVFKGSVYITFKTREQAEKFKNGGPHTYQGRTLMVLWQADYLDQKYDDYD